MTETLDLDALQVLCDAATAHYDINQRRVARRQVVSEMPLLIAEVRRLRPYKKRWGEPEAIERYRRALARINPSPAIEERVLEIFKLLFTTCPTAAEDTFNVMIEAVDIAFVMRAEINRHLEEEEGT